jgi:fumarylpyruvate hydrolase
MTYPPATADLQHELELVIAIGRGGRDIPASEALEHVFAYAVGLDMTRRDLQHQAKKKGGPWAAGKDFDQAAICATMVRAADVGHPATGTISLHVNGETRQQADLSHMVWSVPEIIRFLSGTLTLEPGDLIYTGTPAGVGPVVPGDLLEGEISGLPSLTVRITPPRAASEVAAP